MGCQMRVCAIYGMQFTRINCVLLGNTMETIQLNNMCVIRGKQVCDQKCVRRLIITQRLLLISPVICFVYRRITCIYITKISIQLHK